MIERPRSSEEALVGRLREVTERYDFSTLVTGVSEASSGRSVEISRLFGRGLEPVIEPVVQKAPNPALRGLSAEPPPQMRSPVLASALVALIVSLAVSLTALKLAPAKGIVYADSPAVNAVLVHRPDPTARSVAVYSGR